VVCRTDSASFLFLFPPAPPFSVLTETLSLDVAKFYNPRILPFSGASPYTRPSCATAPVPPLFFSAVFLAPLILPPPPPPTIRNNLRKSNDANSRIPSSVSPPGLDEAFAPPTGAGSRKRSPVPVCSPFTNLVSKEAIPRVHICVSSFSPIFYVSSSLFCPPLSKEVDSSR